MTALTSPIACGRTCLCNSAVESTAEDARARCPVLHEFGSQRLSMPAKPVAERRAAYHAELAKARLQETSTNVPYKLQQLGVPYDNVSSSRNPMHNAAMSAAMRFRDADRAGARVLILAGEHGVGKSTAAAWLLGKAVERYAWNDAPSGGKAAEPFVWAHASEVTSEVDFGKVNPEWLESLRRCQLLVLDDLGKDATEVGRTALRDVLVARMEKHRPTVITANIPPVPSAKRPQMPSLRGVYGDSWFERAKAYALVPDLSEEKNLRGRSGSRSNPSHTRSNP